MMIMMMMMSRRGKERSTEIIFSMEMVTDDEMDFMYNILKTTGPELLMS